MSGEIRYFFGRVMLRISYSIAFLSPKIAIVFAHAIGKIAFLIFKKKRQIALRNLELAFGKERGVAKTTIKSAEELKKIAYLGAQEMCRCGIEIFQFLHSPSKVKIKINGRKNLDAAINQGKGVILISAHFGNFPLMMARLAQEGYKINTLMRSMRDLKAEKFFSQIRQGLNIRSIMIQPRQISVQKCLTVLGNSEILVIPIDQHAGAGGVFVDFFGSSAATPAGPVVFALRSGAPILPAFILREGGQQKIIIEPAIELCSGGNKEKVVEKTMAKLTKIVESYVRKHPEQWNWMHKRWKGNES